MDNPRVVHTLLWKLNLINILQLYLFQQKDLKTKSIDFLLCHLEKKLGYAIVRLIRSDMADGIA